MHQPDITPLTPLTLATHYTPIYPTTRGLTQKKLEKLIQLALEYAASHQILNQPRPALSGIFSEHSISPLDALSTLHHPPANLHFESLHEQLERWRRRLAEDESISHIACIQRYQQHVKQRQGIAQPLSAERYQKFLSQLPFELTGAQQQAWREISEDLAQSIPMQRLLQGDVGSGKTVIAALCALTATENHMQCAIMAPTELLARQHYEQLQAWFSDTELNIELLTGHLSAKQKRDALAALQSHQAHIIIGTQALFQKAVEFAALGLVVIDEQHRFGVAQRMALCAKNPDRHPHQLTLTATPIPRTLAMTFYGVVSVSVLDELPKGRKPVITAVMPEQKRPQLIERLRVVLSQSEQVFWVCTLIEESEHLNSIAAAETHAFLTQALPTARIGLVHGQLNDAEKQATVTAFKDKALDLLVATTVIEVGMNVPNANLLIIENSERMGLAQLHQLRGRVGRGQQQAYCVLLYKPPLSENSRKRLDIIRNSHDGFKISEADLELRGPGEWLGVRQSGLLSFRIAELEKDSDLLPLAEAFVLEHQNTLAFQDLITPWLNNKVDYLNS